MFVSWYILLMSVCVAESSYYYCRPGSTVYDRCGQKCSCARSWFGSYRTNCVRIRKEFTDMTFSERERYIRVIKTASTDWKYKRRYDQLINEHSKLFPSGIHEQRFFLPWHRWYILQYENLLRQIDCRFTVAYWDWSLDSSDPWSADKRENVWNSANTGFGGNGAGEGSCVQTGPFRQSKWLAVTPSGAKCLTRAFNGNPPNDNVVRKVVLQNVFDDFEVMLRINLHDNVHCRIHGTMCTREAASAPEFFLHHGFIDKIWEDWQKRSATNKYAFFSRIRQKMSGTPYYPRDLIDLSGQPGGVRVEYQPSKKKYRTTATGLWRLLPGRRFTPLDDAAIRLFHISRSDVIKARRLEKLLQA